MSSSREREGIGMRGHYMGVMIVEVIVIAGLWALGLYFGP
jgi:hypothetical protein